MKVIFLDIDGVLNSNVCLEDNRQLLINRDNVLLLKELVERTGAVLVLSSGWKLYFDEYLKPVSEEAVYLKKMLHDYEIEFYGKTPDLSTAEIKESKKFSTVKAKEIKSWLYDHTDAEEYIVIDDLSLNDEDINKRLIRTNSETGITKSDVESAISMLTNNN